MTIVASSIDSVRTNSPVDITWQQELKRAVRDPVQLCRMLDLPAEYEPAAIRAADSFPVFAPLEYIGKMRLADPDDPLLRQVLPLAEELDSPAGFSLDPVGDQPASFAPGVIHKYHGRVLMVTTGACAVHCRYCFRRHFPYADQPHSPAAWQPAIEQIAADQSIEEVLLSGGDPLTLVDYQLAMLIDQLAEIPHLKRLRVHTRLPIMIPQRVNDELLDWLAGTRLTPIVVIHANHATELDGAVAESVGRLINNGIPVLNQAVLLRGVNDNVDALVSLCSRLVDLRVIPYYLHQLDRVIGAAHFEVPIRRGIELVTETRQRLPGYAVPRYVQEVAGEAAKIVIA